jgi:hypothetical protein
MKAAGAFEGLPRELRTRHNMGTDILREQERSNSANVIFRTALGDLTSPPKGAVVRARLVFRESSRLALSLSGPLLFQYQNKNFTVVCLF